MTRPRRKRPIQPPPINLKITQPPSARMRKSPERPNPMIRRSQPGSNPSRGHRNRALSARQAMPPVRLDGGEEAGVVGDGPGERSSAQVLG
jgi:hypothetical protein